MMLTMPDEREIFDTARRISDAAARVTYLAEACGDDTSFRRRVEALLQVHDEQESFLASPALTSDLDPTLMFTARGTVIGRYKVLEPIGEGGYGTVFMAEQTTPVRRKVALKVIKAGMDTQRVIARFEAERQALALMDHPNIAKVFDAGVTDAGRPYFVMELVTGTPITRYCDEHKLTPKQRLELFIRVCQAVQHAHQKGVIHRDLKPTNVLVAPYDGKPVPKVIDFGVAKASGQRLTERTMFTGFGDVIGTPQYMSPEQAELNQLDVDTRSDIYSLGVLLYELLTGTTPLEAKRVKEAALLEVLRVIREEEPPRPSTRLTATDELPSIAAQRGLEPKSLSGIIKGELDWIVMKALDKDRDRRYETANGLARDVERYLRDEAVTACPPSATYRLRKLVRRHRLAVSAAVTFVLILMALVAGLTITNRIVTKSRNEVAAALRQKEQALRDLGFLHRGNPKLSEEFLRRSISSLEALHLEHPERPEYRQQLGWTRFMLSLILRAADREAEAQVAAEEAREIYEALIAEHAEAADYRAEIYGVYGTLAGMYASAGRMEDSAEMFTRRVKTNPDNHWSWYVAAGCYLFIGDVERYRSACRELLDRFETLHAERPECAERTAKTCALMPDSVPDFPRVERLAERTLIEAEKHRHYGQFILTNALIDYRGGRYGRALDALRARPPKVQGDSVDATAFALLAMAHHRLGHADQARASLESARSIVAGTPPDKRGVLIDWLHCEILLREAEQLLGQPKE